MYIVARGAATLQMSKGKVKAPDLGPEIIKNSNQRLALVSGYFKKF